MTFRDHLLSKKLKKNAEMMFSAPSFIKKSKKCQNVFYERSGTSLSKTLKKMLK